MESLLGFKLKEYEIEREMKKNMRAERGGNSVSSCKTKTEHFGIYSLLHSPIYIYIRLIKLAPNTKNNRKKHLFFNAGVWNFGKGAVAVWFSSSGPVCFCSVALCAWQE